MAKKRYTELAKSRISKNRNAVISEDSDNKITLAQQAIIKEEDGRETIIFFKGAITIDMDKLPTFRDAINEAIEKLEDAGKL